MFGLDAARLRCPPEGVGSRRESRPRPVRPAPERQVASERRGETGEAPPEGRGASEARAGEGEGARAEAQRQVEGGQEGEGRAHSGGRHPRRGPPDTALPREVREIHRGGGPRLGGHLQSARESGARRHSFPEN